MEQAFLNWVKKLLLTTHIQSKGLIMKQKKIVILLLVATSLFAKDVVSIEQLKELKSEIKSEAQQIGIEAYEELGEDNNRSKLYIKKECQSLLVNFEYLEDENIVKHILLPNCLEFAIEARNKE